MTHSEVIILRLLTTRDRYGYEIDRLIEENRMRHWANIGFSSIYHVLNKMETHSLLSSYHVKESGSPRRKVYRISDEGKAALREEVFRMLSSPAEHQDDFTVGLVTSDVLSDEEFRHCLASYKEHLSQRLDFYRREIPQRTREKERVALALQRHAVLIEAEIEWLEGV
jgi:DNA-binding PadR family transcriptional regulator